MTIALSPETLAAVKDKAQAGCFMCRRALEALGPELELRDWPPGDDQVEYPVAAQKYHIMKETGR